MTRRLQTDLANARSALEVEAKGRAADLSAHNNTLASLRADMEGLQVQQP